MKDKYDFLIVGAGFFGAICAHQLASNGYTVHLIEKRSHLGGNCFTEQLNGINVHTYGPHVFHSPDRETWDWINSFVNFNGFKLNVPAFFRGRVYALPFNMWTFSQIYGVYTVQDVKSAIQADGFPNDYEAKNLEEQAIKMVGRKAYEILIKGYTKKQWLMEPTDLPPQIIKRLPLRFIFDNNYFNDPYQGIPIGGYTQIFEKLLNNPNISVQTSTDYFKERSHWDNAAEFTIFTGPIDAYFDYEFGELAYKTVSFEHKYMSNIDAFIGTAQMNFTDELVPHTRIIEHKFFEDPNIEGTWVTYEQPIEYKAGVTDPYYPVNDAKNNALFDKYKEKANALPNVYFGGRLGEYKYYDMHQVIKSAFKMVDALLEKKMRF